MLLRVLIFMCMGKKCARTTHTERTDNERHLFPVLACRKTKHSHCSIKRTHVLQSLTGHFLMIELGKIHYNTVNFCFSLMYCLLKDCVFQKVMEKVFNASQMYSLFSLEHRLYETQENSKVGN